MIRINKDNIVKDFLSKPQIKINGSFISWEDLRLLPRNTADKLNNYWNIIQKKKSKIKNV